MNTNLGRDKTGLIVSYVIYKFLLNRISCCLFEIIISSASFLCIVIEAKSSMCPNRKLNLLREKVKRVP